MPIYRYQCTDCGAREEHLQKVSDPPMETCEVCGGTLSKLMTAAAFHLKGGGWYKDLYASTKSDDSTPAKTGSADTGSTPTPTTTTTTPTTTATPTSTPTAPASTPSDSSKAKGTGSGSSNSTPSSAA